MADSDQLAKIQYYAQLRNDRNKAGYTGFHPVDSYFDKLYMHDTRSGKPIPKGPRGTSYYGGSKRRSSGSRRRGSKRHGSKRHGGSRRRR